MHVHAQGIFVLCPALCWLTLALLPETMVSITVFSLTYDMAQVFQFHRHDAVYVPDFFHLQNIFLVLIQTILCMFQSHLYSKPRFYSEEILHGPFYMVHPWAAQLPELMAKPTYRSKLTPLLRQMIHLLMNPSTEITKLEICLPYNKPWHTCCILNRRSTSVHSLLQIPKSQTSISASALHYVVLFHRHPRCINTHHLQWQTTSITHLPSELIPSCGLISTDSTRHPEDPMPFHEDNIQSLPQRLIYSVVRKGISIISMATQANTTMAEPVATTHNRPPSLSRRGNHPDWPTVSQMRQHSQPWRT